MQPLRTLENWLIQHHSALNIYSTYDFRQLLPNLSYNAYKTLLTRAVKSGVLDRICRGIYQYKKINKHDGLTLFHIAAKIRANEFNYISLETVLSDSGVISQIPMNYISVMTSGRSNSIDCGKYGTIDFIHTSQKQEDIIHMLHYDHRCGMLRANVPLAIRDMKATKRNLDLINWDEVDEYL